MLLLPPCKFRYGIVKDKKPLIRCEHKGEVPIEECYSCKIPYETNELLKTAIDIHAQFYDKFSEFHDKLEELIDEIIRISDDIAETSSNITGNPKDEEMAKAIGTALVSLLITTANRYGNVLANKARYYAEYVIKVMNHPYFSKVLDVISEILNEKYGIR